MMQMDTGELTSSLLEKSGLDEFCTKWRTRAGKWRNFFENIKSRY